MIDTTTALAILASALKKAEAETGASESRIARALALEFGTLLEEMEEVDPTPRLRVVQ
ncbi:MAG TPA: hypothetical protein VKR27_00975 [Acidimicrobiales bacterium]|nr:hypothetical protein [Acidimicrobiales bacterium]